MYMLVVAYLVGVIIAFPALSIRQFFISTRVEGACLIGFLEALVWPVIRPINMRKEEA